jgi:oligopeptide/dipeptide ABC transporter ATP-binding protein
MPDPNDILLRVENLTVRFDTDDGEITAADDVGFHVRRGEVLGIVGESGCGKTVTAMSILRLIPSPPGRIASGRVLFDGQDLAKMPVSGLRKVRGRRISMIFQEPMTALSPLKKVGPQLAEMLELHRPVSRVEAARIGREWLEKVGIPDPERILGVYPFQLSGGMRQRVMIAMALMLNPDLIVADEPTTALDVTIQAQVFDLIRKMKGEKTSLLLITHDMGVIWEMCDRVVVMYASHVVEEGPVRDIFDRPLHPYTEGLLQAMPQLAPRGGRLPAIPGQVPSPRNYPAGCHFCDRCPHAFDRCRVEKPSLYASGGRWARCFLVEEGRRS